METERERLYNEAIEELDNNDELFVEMVNQLDWYNGFADGYRCLPMSELDEYFCDKKLTEFLAEITSEFNLQDNYFYISIWGIESTDDIVDLYRSNTDSEEVLDEILNLYPRIDIWGYSDFESLIESIILCDDEESEEEDD